MTTKRKRNPGQQNPSAGVVLGIIGIAILGGIGYAVWQVADAVKDVKNRLMLPKNASNEEVRKRVRQVLVSRGAELIKEKMLSGFDGDVDGRLFSLKNKPEVIWGEYLLVDPQDAERSGYVYAVGVKGKPITSGSSVAKPMTAQSAMSQMRSQIASRLADMLDGPVVLDGEDLDGDGSGGSSGDNSTPADDRTPTCAQWDPDQSIENVLKSYTGKKFYSALFDEQEQIDPATNCGYKAKFFRYAGGKHFAVLVSRIPGSSANRYFEAKSLNEVIAKQELTNWVEDTLDVTGINDWASTPG